MSIQIAVRLPDELVAYLDGLVGGGAGSRASIVSRALADHRRRLLAEQDAEILARTGDYDDFANIVTPVGLDDLA